MENGPLSGTRTSASGNSRVRRRPASITIGMRPAHPGFKGGSRHSAAADPQIGLVTAGMPTPWGLSILPP